MRFVLAAPRAVHEAARTSRPVLLAAMTCAALISIRLEAGDCDIRSYLNKARDKAKKGTPELALQALAQLDDQVLRECFQTGQLKLPDYLVFYRERGDLFLQSRRTQRLELAKADYALYLEVYISENADRKPLTEDGARRLSKPLPEPLAEPPRIVLNAFGNACVKLAKRQDLIDQYEEVAQEVPDLFDRSSLEKWHDAIFSDSRPDPALVQSYCLTLHAKRTRISPAARRVLRKGCPAPPSPAKEQRASG